MESQHEVATLEPRELSILEVVQVAANSPNVDVAKMRELLDLKERYDAKQAETAFHQAMKDAQAEMQPVLRESTNSHTNSRYAKLEKIDSAIRPIYTKHGFSLSFNSPAAEGGDVTVTCTAFHSAGHSRNYELSGSLDGAGSQGKSNKTPIQALGSTVTYLRRYLTCMIFNVVLTNEDNDGNTTKAKAVFISQQQGDNVDSLIAELGMDGGAVANFLKIMEASTVREIKADRYRQAMMLLEARRGRR